VDSIPAVFAISQDPFVVYTSNIFAIMGLRALFFLVENILHKFHHLQKGLAFILIFIGLKMLSGIVGIHISSIVSLIVIMSALGASLVLSVIFPKKI
jgi:tellurite resistance protein TerC